MKIKLLNAFEYCTISFALVLMSYLFLYTQSENAKMSVIGTAIYLLQYFVIFFIISYIQPKAFISLIFGSVNAFLLFLLQINRKSDMMFAWDWMLLLDIVIVAILNLVISFVFTVIILVIKQIKKNKNKNMG